MMGPQTQELILGRSAAIGKVRALIECVAPTDISVLISGPTGSGKELVAQAIHAISGRSGPFVAFNVCAIAETMFDDALFGHVRGAFTGAMHSSLGYLREADNGTAFLDEISGLSINAQAKLLRAVETREFRPVGAPNDVRSNFRLVTAVNEDLWQLQRAGGFRADLAHRLSSFVIRVPSLKDRKEDVLLLAETFLREMAKDDNVSIRAEPARLLMQHDWLGNVRELRHVIRSAATLGGTSELRAEDVREALAWMAPQVGLSPRRSIADRALIDVLEQCDWDAMEASRALGVHQTTIYRRLKRMGGLDRLRRDKGPKLRVLPINAKAQVESA